MACSVLLCWIEMPTLLGLTQTRTDRKQNTVKLRRAKKADGATVFELLWAARNEIPLHDSFYSEGTREWVCNHCSKRRVLVIEEYTVVVGAMLVQADEIFYLVISPNHRRKGYARMLLRRAKRK